MPTKGETSMKKILTAVALAGAISAASVVPAQAYGGFRDGEYGYRVGCAINWYVFGNWDVCQELLR